MSKFNELWPLVGGHVVLAPVANHGFSNLAGEVVLQNNEGLRAFATVRILNPDNRNLLDGRVSVKQVFHFRGKDTVARRLDEFSGSPQEFNVALLASISPMSPV